MTFIFIFHFQCQILSELAVITKLAQWQQLNKWTPSRIRKQNVEFKCKNVMQVSAGSTFRVLFCDWQPVNCNMQYTHVVLRGGNSLFVLFDPGVERGATLLAFTLVVLSLLWCSSRTCRAAWRLAWGSDSSILMGPRQWTSGGDRYIRSSDRYTCRGDAQLLMDRFVKFRVWCKAVNINLTN